MYCWKGKCLDLGHWIISCRKHSKLLVFLQQLLKKFHGFFVKVTKLVIDLTLPLTFLPIPFFQKKLNSPKYVKLLALLMTPFRPYYKSATTNLSKLFGRYCCLVNVLISTAKSWIITLVRKVFVMKGIGSFYQRKLFFIGILQFHLNEFSEYTRFYNTLTSFPKTNI